MLSEKTFSPSGDRGNRYHSHLNSAALILKKYNGSEPFHLFIKKYFAANKKFGSKDRKQISSLCYNFFRLGKAVKEVAVEERILIGTFLCENKDNELLDDLKPEWNALINQSIEEKVSFIKSVYSFKNIFPFTNELSEGIDPDKYDQSFLIQPKVFLRVRPGNTKKVTGKLSGAGIQYELTENCITLPNASKIDSVIELDKEAVVQDYNSQRVGEFIQLSIVNSQLPIDVWDCCAASGGKSILAFDINPNIELTVSDKRASIIENLKKRFEKAGIKKYDSFVADITSDSTQLPNKKYDLIICDVPCTGSGTWARTPEQLYYFKHQQIQNYATLQKQIVKNVIPYLKEGGKLLYITCSVFKKENEEIINYIEKNSTLKVETLQLLEGYEMQADTLFAALLTAPVI